jgi:hypothetical protein
MSRTGTRYVPLRVVAAYAGLALKWDAASKQAVVRIGTAARESARSVKLAAAGEGLLLYRERLWISLAACQERLGVALRTDTKGQLAYLQQEWSARGQRSAPEP